jgi:hypothetical protein
MGKSRNVLIAALLSGIVAIPLITATAAVAQSTRDQYIAQADPICAESLTGQGQALRGVVSDAKHGDTKKAARKFRRANVFFSNGIEKLAALEAPPEDSALLGTWIQALRAEVPIVNNFANALAHRRDRQLRKITAQLSAAYAQAQGLVRTYGFQVCNQF